MSLVRRGTLALTFIGAVASFLTLVAPPPTLAVEHAVEIGDSVFSPATLTIGVGDTVTWRNADDRPHTVTSNDGAFDSGNLDEGVGFSFTFSEPGKYTYRCDYHPEMQGTIVVEATSAPDRASAPDPASGGSTATATDSPTTAGDTTAAAATHAPGHEDAQPDTALEIPVSAAWIAPLLIGLGLVSFAFGLIPPTGAAARRDTEATNGWRR